MPMTIISTITSPERAARVAISYRPARESTWHTTEVMMPMAAILKMISISMGFLRLYRNPTATAAPASAPREVYSRFWR